MFTLDPQLEKDTEVVGYFPLSLVLLSRDANYPWCLLVPRHSDLREIHHLGEEDQLQLMRESCHLSEVMADLFMPDKMNVAALGNMVPQLHVHHVARFKDDGAWPSPVWGVQPAKAYSDEDLAQRVSRLRGGLTGLGFEAIDSLDELKGEEEFLDRANT